MVKRTLIGFGLLMTVVVSTPRTVVAADRSGLLNAWYWTVAAGVNVIPGLSAFYAPKCLPGYVLCKLVFAGASLAIAGEHLFMGGDVRAADRRAILHRGFGGDWFARADHIAGDLTLEPFPESASAAGDGGFEPPPR